MLKNFSCSYSTFLFACIYFLRSITLYVIHTFRRECVYENETAREKKWLGEDEIKKKDFCLSSFVFRMIYHIHFLYFFGSIIKLICHFLFFVYFSLFFYLYNICFISWMNDRISSRKYKRCQMYAPEWWISASFPHL